MRNSTVSWNVTTTSFSVELTSANKTIYEKHHTAKVHNTTGTSNVGTDTVYRVASITKVFASLALLLEVPWAIDAPARWFVPELNGLEGYEEITLRMLANHMSGIPRDGRDWRLTKHALWQADIIQDMRLTGTVRRLICFKKVAFRSRLKKIFLSAMALGSHPVAEKVCDYYNLVHSEMLTWW